MKNLVQSRSQDLDWEVELAVVIGKSGHRIARENALEHVAGYAIANDISARGLIQRKDYPQLGTDWLRLWVGPGNDLGRAISISEAAERRGGAMRLLQSNGQAASGSEPQEHLLKLLRRARSWWKEMNDSQFTAAEIARKHSVTKSYVSRVVRLNFLAPEVVEAIVSGSQPAALDAKTLLELHDVPLAWSEQMRELHFK